MPETGNPTDPEIDEESSDISKINPNKDINLKFPPKLIKVIESLPEKEREVVKAMFMAISIKESFRGPIPPPEMLAKYNDAFPDGAQQIFNLTKEQSVHRMDLEKSTIKEQQKQGRNGQIFGFILGFFGLLIAGLCAYTGHDAVGGIIGTLDICGLVGIFVLGRYKQQEDLNDKKDS